MRILKIEIENINSLKGYWCIDFLHPDYKKNHDLFVISGETGSGKTNEVMTRHTAKCMVRVTYECKKGKFESSFFQRKLRDKLDGNLGKAEGCVRKLDEPGIFENLSIKDLAKKNGEIIQLGYEEFCRSIMLAQGQFDSFLSGDPRDRAKILAKLTGTEKYREFAEKLWEKAKTKILLRRLKKKS